MIEFILFFKSGLEWFFFWLLYDFVEFWGLRLCGVFEIII